MNRAAVANTPDPYERQRVEAWRRQGRGWQVIAQSLGRSVPDTLRFHADNDRLPRVVVAIEPPAPPVPEIIDNSTLGLMTRTAREVADRHGITVDDLKGPSRLRRIAHPRQEYMALCAEVGRSTTQIGDFLGRDHATVIHGVRAHRARAAKGTAQ